MLTCQSYSGIATHYLHSSSLPDLEARLGELQFKDSATLQERHAIINSTIEEFTTGLPHDQPISAPLSGDIREAIEYAFQPANDFDATMKALQGLAEMEVTQPAHELVKPWAQKTLQTILQRSPTSVRVAFRQLRAGARWSIAETFRREHYIASKFMEHPDFVEGVSSLLIRKPKTTPQWSPASASDVTERDVDEFFDGQPELALLSTADYKDYPHAWIGLPKEREVAAFFTSRAGLSKEEVVKHFVQTTNGKLGTKEKVQEILDRKTETKDGELSWKR